MTAFAVHALHDDHAHARTVEGRSFEDAALAFIEDWHPKAGPDGEVSVLVEDGEGRRQCFRVDLGSGETQPCE